MRFIPHRNNCAHIRLNRRLKKRQTRLLFGRVFYALLKLILKGVRWRSKVFQAFPWTVHRLGLCSVHVLLLRLALLDLLFMRKKTWGGKDRQKERERERERQTDRLMFVCTKLEVSNFISSL